MPNPKEFPDLEAVAQKPDSDREQERKERVAEILKEAEASIEVIRYPKQKAIEYCRLMTVAHGVGIEMSDALQKAERIFDALSEGRDKAAVQDAIDRAKAASAAVAVSSEQTPQISAEDIDRELEAFSSKRTKTEMHFSLSKIARIAQESRNMTEELAEKLYGLAETSGMPLEKESSIPFLTNLGGKHIQEAMNIVDRTRENATGKVVMAMKVEDRVRCKIAAFSPRLAAGESYDAVFDEIASLISKISQDPHGHFKAARLGSLSDALIVENMDPRPLLREMMETYAKSTGENEQATFIGWVLDRYFAYARKVAQR